MNVVIGIGCDRNTSLQTLNTALDQALAEAGLQRTAVIAMASIDKKKDETGILNLAQNNNWPLYFFAAEALAQVEVPNPSEMVRRHMGTPAVAEAAALLCAGASMDQLIVEKYKFRGNDERNATISIARANKVWNEHIYSSPCLRDSV